MLYYMDDIETHTAPSYFKLDLRLGWKPTENLDISLVGQNLLEDQHKEWDSAYGFDNTEVPRGGYVKVTWDF